MASGTEATVEPTVAADQDFIDDLFRRVDQNDNGSISFDEFRVYFRDGVMTSNELRDIFDEIDTGGNGSIETGEMFAFFTQNIGGLAPMFSSLSAMNREMTQALQSTHGGAAPDSREKFFTRFFLKELVQALSALQSPLQVAINAMTEEARSSRPTAIPEQEILLPSEARRAGSKNHDVGSASALSGELDRLATLVDKLSGKVHCGTLEEQGDTAILATFEMDVMPEQIETFQIAFTSYLGQTQFVRGCIRATATHNDESVVLYVVFESEEAFDLHLRSEHYRGFQRVCADTLTRPLKFTSMNTPRTWW